jgi:hypothetical protein
MLYDSVGQSVYDARRQRYRLEARKHPLPENVFDTYVKYWSGVSFKT